MGLEINGKITPRGQDLRDVSLKYGKDTMEVKLNYFLFTYFIVSSLSSTHEESGGLLSPSPSCDNQIFTRHFRLLGLGKESPLVENYRIRVTVMRNSVLLFSH